MHDAEVVEHRDQRREEDDDRQHLDGEDEADTAARIGQTAEQEADALIGIIDDLTDGA
ncbi:hypothetical protein [Cobetia sp. ICG0124]|uniref:hypothetical protein n=1 Tax=Cobetia sp. ICG0124 TaxID=2053669 RepID=UPI001F0BC8A0|nr:hypothetical protein [Cobetia sp. ICG0124]